MSYEQMMTAAELVEHTHIQKGEPTYDELKAINAEMLEVIEAALKKYEWGGNGRWELPDDHWMNKGYAVVAKAKGEKDV